jgi:hypothetical protein
MDTCCCRLVCNCLSKVGGRDAEGPGRRYKTTCYRVDAAAGSASDEEADMAVS